MKIVLLILGILFAVLALIFLIVYFLKVNIYVRYDSKSGDFRSVAKVLFYSYTLYPEEESVKAKKKNKPKKDNILKIIQKDLSGVAKAAHVGQAIVSKAGTSGKKQKQDSSRNELFQKVRYAASALRILALKAKVFLPPFFDSLTFRLESFHVKIGSGDAADTAVAYGLVCAAAEGLYAVSAETDRLKIKDDIRIQTDFLSADFEWDISLRIDIRVIRALRALYLAEDAYYEDKYRRNRR